MIARAGAFNQLGNLLPEMCQTSFGLTFFQYFNASATGVSLGPDFFKRHVLFIVKSSRISEIPDALYPADKGNFVSQGKFRHVFPHRDAEFPGRGCASSQQLGLQKEFGICPFSERLCGNPSRDDPLVFVRVMNHMIGRKFWRYIRLNGNITPGVKKGNQEKQGLVLHEMPEGEAREQEKEEGGKGFVTGKRLTRYNPQSDCDAQRNCRAGKHYFFHGHFVLAVFRIVSRSKLWKAAPRIPLHQGGISDLLIVT